jgi:AcrR family transcriptional regulator
MSVTKKLVTIGNTRDQIIDSSLVLFAERGFRGVSISELGQACGMAKSSVLHHFSSKAKLYSAVLDRVDESLEAIEASVLDDPGDTRGKTRKLISSLFLWSSEQPEHACLVVFELLELRSRERKPNHWNLAPAVRKFLKLIEEGQGDGVIYRCEPAAVLELILGATTYKVLSEPVTGAMLGKPYTRRMQSKLNRDVIALLERAIIA